jgi:DNA polymerase III epsilon subunit-like protein
MSIKQPKVLIFDIETAPVLAYVWSLWDQNVALNQIEQDWFVMSWSAKWLHEDKVMYMDQRKSRNVENDKKLLQAIWKLLDEADIVVTHHGKAFDQKKLYARFILNGMKPPSGFKHHDTKQIASKHFAFTSNKLEYLSDKLNKKYKKIKNSGFTLWTRCMAGDVEAWDEMEKYNKYDVMATEELYMTLRTWEPTVDYNIYSEDLNVVCVCGSGDFRSKGYAYTSAGKYKRFACTDCGKNYQSKQNLLSKNKRNSLHR